MNPKVSVIMPVYNAEKYLEHSIECLLKQNFQEFELLLVDDGSSDLSSKICDEYAANDPRIRVFHQKNLGTCAARNLGLDNAAGDYVTFLDDDDECYSGFLDENYKKAIESNADVLCFSVDHQSENLNRVVVTRIQSKTQSIKSIELSTQYAFLRSNDNFIFVWNHFYKRKILRDVRFNPVFRHGLEDILFNMEILPNVESCFLFDASVYYKHISRRGSSSLSFSRYESDISEYIFFFEREYHF